MEPIQDNIRERFPLLARTLGAYPLTYLDNGATTQKPEEVICAVERYYRYQNANVHRGVHTLSQQATDAMEAAREKVRGFLHAPSAREIIFTRGTTESINLAICCNPGTRSSSRRWSTTPTSCPGSWPAQRAAPTCA